MFYRFRHVRRLIPIVVSLAIMMLLWCSLVIGAAIGIGGVSFIWDRNFAQNVIASLLLLPVGLTVAVVVGTLLQRHTLRFQGREWGDRLCSRITTTIFGFIVYLNRDCKFPIDLSGPVSSRFVERAREAVVGALAKDASSLPAAFETRLYEAVAELNAFFAEASEFRLAFPNAFELAEDLQKIITEIKSGRSTSSPANTALILLHKSAEIIRDLE